MTAYIILKMGDRTMDHGKFPVYDHIVISKMKGVKGAAINRAKKMLRKEIEEDYSLNEMPYEIVWDINRSGVCITV